jgi:hypothetical protein
MLAYTLIYERIHSYSNVELQNWYVAVEFKLR